MTPSQNPTKRLAHLAGLSETDTVSEQTQVADQVTLHRIDDASAVPRPENISGTWVEEEYGELDTEQGPLWAASGIEASRPMEVEAAGLGLAADAAERMATGHAPVLEAAATRFADTTEALAPFRRRPPGGKLLHYAAKGALLTGDMVGVTLMGINIGDYPVLAGLMSISAAAAAVISGLTGAELRDLRSSQRRLRDVDSLTDKQRPFQHLFTGIDDGIRIVKIVCGISAGTALAIAAGIFSGRSELEGHLVGLIYGGIAVAVAGASFLESYMYADEIADQIDNASAAYEKELARHERLAGSESWRTSREKSAEATSIVYEHEQRGDAAQHRVRALKWGILRRNPGVVGHGPAPSAVGRTMRSGGGDAQ